MSSSRTASPPTVDANPRLGDGAADGEARDVVFQEDRQGVVEIVLVDLEDEAEFFGEERGQGLIAGGREFDIDAAVAGKGHLEQGGHETAVGAIVAGGDDPLGEQRLDRVEGAAEELDIVDIGALVADLTPDLGQGRAAETVAAAAEIDKEQPAASRELEIRRHGAGDVGAGAVGRDHQRARGFDGLAVGRQGGHGDGVLAAVDGDPEGRHHVAHGLGGVVQGRALAGELGRPHPVGRAAHVFERGDLRPHQIGQGLAHREPCHGRGIEQALDGLFADGGGAAGGRRGGCRATTATSATVSWSGPGAGLASRRAR